jgi:DNA-binding IclR family transcriptional regulator
MPESLFEKSGICATLHIMQSLKKVARPPGRVTQETTSIQSLDRGLLILETVGKSKTPVTLGQLTEVLGIDRSSAFRLANTLKRRGFLSNPSVGKDYILGPSVWRLSRLYDWSKMLATIAHDHLNSLANVTNETAHLALREGRKALFIDHVASNQVISISGQTGELVPLYCTSHGKALLADFGEAELRTLFGGGKLEPYTRQTLVSISDLAENCRKIRARGYATDDGEFIEGVRCLAAPIRNRQGAVIASIGISAPKSRFPAQRDAEYANRVTEVAREIGKLVGGEDADESRT